MIIKCRKFVKREDQRNLEVIPSEAFQWTGGNDRALIDFLDSRSGRWSLGRATTHDLLLTIPGKVLIIQPEDYVVRNAFGELDVCNPPLFKNLYEEEK